MKTIGRLLYDELTRNCRNCGGQLVANLGPRPDAALMQAAFRMSGTPIRGIWTWFPAT